MSPTAFIGKLALCSAVLFSIAIGFVWAVDPYGVSPVHISIPTWNQAKPKRQDIDREIKAFEVWRYQPKTIFMGTSRLHQSMIPAVLDGTRFAPAYNAAIPASTFAENLAQIRLFYRLNKNLKVIFLETFLYNFLRDEAPVVEETVGSVIKNYVDLNFSLAALGASVQTIFANHVNAHGGYVGRDGNFVHDPWFDSKDSFSQTAYIQAIADIQKMGINKAIRPSVTSLFDQIVSFCRDRGIALYLITAPNYPWDDYRIVKTGLWPALSEQFHYLSKFDNVVSFAQHNAITEEEPGSHMKWWYDPIHFSSDAGTLMLRSIVAGRSVGPDNFMRPVKPDTVAAVLKERRDAINDWASRHTDFVRQFDAAIDIDVGNK